MATNYEKFLRNYTKQYKDFYSKYNFDNENLDSLNEKKIKIIRNCGDSNGNLNKYLNSEMNINLDKSEKMLNYNFQIINNVFYIHNNFDLHLPGDVQYINQLLEYKSFYSEIFRLINCKYHLNIGSVNLFDYSIVNQIKNGKLDKILNYKLPIYVSGKYSIPKIISDESGKIVSTVKVNVLIYSILDQNQNQNQNYVNIDIITKLFNLLSLETIESKKILIMRMYDYYIANTDKKQIIINDMLKICIDEVLRDKIMDNAEILKTAICSDSKLETIKCLLLKLKWVNLKTEIDYIENN